MPFNNQFGNVAIIGCRLPMWRILGHPDACTNEQAFLLFARKFADGQFLSLLSIQYKLGVEDESAATGNARSVG